MNFCLKHDTNPFRLLLYLESLLLASCGVAVLVETVQKGYFPAQFAETLTFCLGIIFSLHLVNILLIERHVESQRLTAQEQSQHYVLKLENLVAIQERNRIARSIHDSVGHALTALNIQLQTAIQLSQPNPVQAQMFLTQAQQMGLTAMQKVRQSVSALQVDVQGDPSLEATIATIIGYCRQRPDVLTSIYIREGVLLAPQVALILSRVMQEALVTLPDDTADTKVQLAVSASSSAICFTIEDNDQMPKVKLPPTRSELQKMQERIAGLEGRFQITTESGSGCRLTVELLPEKVT